MEDTNYIHQAKPSQSQLRIMGTERDTDCWRRQSLNCAAACCDCFRLHVQTAGGGKV